MRWLLNQLQCLFFLLFALNGAAAGTVKLTQYSTDDGLNQGTVSRVIQDQQGYLWIGTLQGINRFDGYRIASPHSPNNSLNSSASRLLFEDSKGLLWLSVEPNLNYILDKSSDTLNSIQLTAPDNYTLNNPVFISAVEDSDSNLWLSTYSELFFYQRSNNSFQFVTSLAEVTQDSESPQIFRDLLLLKDQLLMATSSGLFSLDLTSKKSRKLLHTDTPTEQANSLNVKKLKLNSLNKVLVGTVEGLFQLDLNAINQTKQSYTAKRLVSELNIWEIIEKPQFYWLATNDGLYKLSKAGELEFIFRYSDTPFNSSDDDILTLYEDREQNLWLGSRADGLFKWRPNTAIKRHLSMLSPKHKLSNNMITAIKPMPNGDIWIGTENGLNVISADDQSITQMLVNPDEKATISDSTIYGISHNADQVWINSLGGIKVFGLENLKPIDIIFPEEVQKVFADGIYQLYFFDQQNLALLSPDGIYNYNLVEQSLSLIESSKTQDSHNDQLVTIFDTATGDRDSFFIAGIDRLVKFSRTNGTIIPFHALPPSETARTTPADIYRDGDKLWLTYTGIGLYILDANTGKELAYYSEESLQANSLMDIFDDEQNNTWISTNDGLLKINKNNFSVQKFDSNDGFATSEFNGGTKAIVDDGDVYLGSVKGVFQISPNQLSQKTKRVISPQISQVSLLSSNIPPQYKSYNQQSVKLGHNDFGLKVEFSALLFDKPNQVQYRYWMEGDSPIAPTIIKKSELFFPSLESGKNQLFITAIDYATGIESKPVSLSINSVAAPWLSLSAYVAYIFTGVSLLAFSFFRYRRRLFEKIKSHQRLKQSEERLNLALKGGDSGLWDWHAETNQVFEPRLQNLAFESSNDEVQGTISFKQRIQAIHPEDKEKVISTWHTFLQQQESVYDVVYRMKNKHDEWFWYRDMATVSSTNDQGMPTRVTGTFTNITERKKARDQMRLYSKAFENTRDIVFVLNQNKQMIAANQAFYKTTGLKDDDVMHKSVTFISDNQGDKNIIQQVFAEVDCDKHWESEGLLSRNNQPPLAILINASSFLDNDKQRDFVFALTDISKQKQAENALRKLANYDSLTGLPNRALLIDRVNQAIQHCQRRKQKLALFFIDLDRFKQVNDTLGHDIGDLLLINVTHTIRRSIRHDDTLARLGGDEFVVLLEDIEGIDAINRIAQNIIQQMLEPMVLHGHQISVSPSIGIATYPNDGQDTAQLLKHADVAMYHAKSSGRNNFQYFESSMNHAAKQRLKIENKLRHAIDNHEIYFCYQPQYHIKSGKICGMEALARWQTNKGEFIPPAEFIPIAEELGLIIPLTEQLLNLGLANMARWFKQGIKVGLAFNLSAKHLHHHDFNQSIETLLERYDLDSSFLEFELTETVLMKDIDLACNVFGKLSEKNIELSLDDFGTGYSSLRYLSQLPIDKLKIDQSFVNKIGTSEQNDSIIKTIISLSQSLNLRTVAEGIETQEQLDFLTVAGVDQAQGFLLSKPLELAELEILLCDPNNLHYH
jgi:diguanylate cyclase (GGDEF)-like protein/PAS domain S-box-containing protein